MGDQFDSLINVTISYLDNPDTPFKDFLMGKMKRIRVRIEELPVDEQLVGTTSNDKQFKRGFQEWLNARWKRRRAGAVAGGRCGGSDRSAGSKAKTPRPARAADPLNTAMPWRQQPRKPVPPPPVRETWKRPL